MNFKSHLQTPGVQSGHILIKNAATNKQSEDDELPGLSFTIERFEKAIDSPGSPQPMYGKLYLYYTVRTGNKREPHHLWFPFVTTQPQYGGLRWWMIAPCCGRRVRVLYLSQKHTTPICRKCHDLHYQSQVAGFIERHITREKYLLANYGYSWAQIEYDCMRKHYFEVTPEYAWKKECSILKRQQVLLLHLIRFNRLMLKMHIHDLLSLKHDEDKLVYLQHIEKNHGTAYALDLVNMLKISVQVERDAYEISEKVFERLYSAAVTSETENNEVPPASTATLQDEELPIDLKSLIERKKQVEAALKKLEKAA